MRFLLARFAALFAVLFAVSLPALADQDSSKPLAVGDPAPSFEVKDDQGKTWKSADHFGEKIVVVYFYPADMTGGCTAQACAFRDNMGALADKDVKVVGVSGDSVESHQLFKKAHDLNFPLLADVDGKVADAFGVPKTVGEKTVKAVIDGVERELTRNVTTQRWTFIVGRDGKIAYKDDSVNARQDSQKVMAAIKQLR
jgi:thioredoxin-dependent peroxiredoxin